MVRVTYGVRCLPDVHGKVKLGRLGEAYEMEEMSLELLVVYCSSLRAEGKLVFYGSDNSVVKILPLQQLFHD